TATPPASPTPIPTAEIATRAAELSGILRSLLPPPSAQITAIEKQQPELHQGIEDDLAAATRILAGQPTMDMLQAQQTPREGRHPHARQWLQALTQRAILLEGGLDRLTNLERTWRTTHDAAQVSKAPDMLVEQIDASLAAMTTTRTALENQRATVLRLQSVVAREVDRTHAMTARLTEAQEGAVGGLLTRQDPPIWSAQAWAAPVSSLFARTQDFAAGRLADTLRYIRGPSGRMRVHVGLLLLITLAMFAARR